MSKKTTPPSGGERRNPVAKHAHRANRATVFRDRTQYSRKTKHRAREPFPLRGSLPVLSAEKVSSLSLCLYP
jgi:hypothetical protein